MEAANLISAINDYGREVTPADYLSRGTGHLQTTVCQVPEFSELRDRLSELVVGIRQSAPLVRDNQRGFGKEFPWPLPLRGCDIEVICKAREQVSQIKRMVLEGQIKFRVYSVRFAKGGVRFTDEEVYISFVLRSLEEILHTASDGKLSGPRLGQEAR